MNLLVLTCARRVLRRWLGSACHQRRSFPFSSACGGKKCGEALLSFNLFRPLLAFSARAHLHLFTLSLVVPRHVASCSQSVELFRRHSTTYPDVFCVHTSMFLSKSKQANHLSDTNEAYRRSETRFRKDILLPVEERSRSRSIWGALCGTIAILIASTIKPQP